MSDRLKGKVCIVTGTGGSMGRAAALMFARQGAKVVGCDVYPESAEETVEMVRGEGGDMVSLSRCDLTDPASCAKLVDLAVSTYGRVDVLFNNAGRNAGSTPLDEYDVDLWNAVVATNLTGVFLCTCLLYTSPSPRDS